MTQSRDTTSTTQPSYSGFAGLNTAQPDFARHVMNPDEIRKFFNNKSYQARFVYPALPADGFNKPVLFSGEPRQDQTLVLTANIETNAHPQFCATKFARLFVLPTNYIMRDQLRFFEDDTHGPGSFHITSIDCRRTDGTVPWLAKNLLSVHERPGLFLKVAKSDNEFYDNIGIFFPAQVGGCSHKSVQYGEAFVMMEDGMDFTADLRRDIKESFNYLVKKSYGNNEGLYSTTTHLPLDEQEVEPQKKACCC